MKTQKLFFFILICLLTITIISCQKKSTPEIPHLEKLGAAKQLIVDGKPYLVLAGELHNSSSSSRGYMKEFWPKLKASGMNTVLAVVEWSLTEPEEGKFDFTVVDNLIEDARAHHLKLVLLLIRNRRSASIPDEGYGIIINSGPDEYIIYGNNIQVSFSPNTPGPAIAAIARLDEGRFENGKWIAGRRLNGDDIMIDYDLAKKALENKTGTGLKFSGENRNIQRVKLYRYE